MTKASREASKDEAKMDMTPMIDVTFLLLIFFMCTLHFPDLEGKLEANLPKDLGLNIAPPMVNPEEIIRIRIVKSGAEAAQIIVGDNLFKGETRYDALFSFMMSIIRVSSRRVEIDPQADIPYEEMIGVLDVCRKVGSALGGGQGDQLQVMLAAKGLGQD